MITTVKPSARRRWPLRWGPLFVGGAVALSAPAAEPLLGDPLTCYRDEQGRAVRIGDPVRDRYGREIGWVSAEQCARDAPAGKLRVRPNVLFADPVEVDADLVGDVGDGVRLGVSAEQLGGDLEVAAATALSGPKIARG